VTSRLINGAAVAFALFHVWNNLFNTVSELWFAAIHFGGFGALCALSFHKSGADARSLPRSLVDGTLALLSLAAAAYLVLFEDALYAREASFAAPDFVFSALAVLLAIEFTRRTTGWFLPLLIVFSLSYVLFLGRFVPGVFEFPGLSLETVLYRSYFSADGMFGMVANISATYVFMFILFGAFLLKSGAGDFIVDLAGALAGRFRGGADAFGPRGQVLPDHRLCRLVDLRGGGGQGPRVSGYPGVSAQAGGLTACHGAAGRVASR